MLFGKYHIVLFKEGLSAGRTMKVRGWFPLVLLLVIVGLSACNVWLWREWVESRHLRADLDAAVRSAEDQRRQMTAIRGAIDEVSEDVRRVQSFDAKLRIMMNMEKDVTETGPSGRQTSSFARGYLPIHRQELALRRIQDFLDELRTSIRFEEVTQQDLLHALRENRDSLASMPSIWPVIGFITSRFGTRTSPFGGGATQFHKGLDISARTGTPIVASADGTVRLAARDGAYGNCVEVSHGTGLLTKYAHMQRYVVQQGDWVRRGQVIGYVGSTGRSTGPHLHYEVRVNGVPVNPMRYILE